MQHQESSAAIELRARDNERLAALDTLARARAELKAADLRIVTEDGRAALARREFEAARKRHVEAGLALERLINPGHVTSSTDSSAPECTQGAVTTVGVDGMTVTSAEQERDAFDSGMPAPTGPFAWQELEVWLLAYRCEREINHGMGPERARAAAAAAVKALRELAAGGLRPAL